MKKSMHIANGGGFKNKAFTLIELLAVIVILGVIALIVSPIVIGAIEKSEKAAFARSIDGIIESVRIDHSDDSFLAPREYYYEKADLTLLTVGDNKRDEMVNINGQIDGNGFVHVDGYGNITIDNICNTKYCASGNEDDITITDNEDGTITDFDKNDPVITLNGKAIVYVELNGTYKEEGATARTKVGDKLEYTTEIKKDNKVVESIKTKEEGTYKITYTTTHNEKTVSVTRTVAVLEMTPVITITESNPNYVKNQEILVNVSAIKPNTVTEFTVEIKKDGTSESKEAITGVTKTLNLNTTGVYEVIVTVIDNNNHKNTVSKTYKIDTTGPVITFNPETVTLKVNEVTGYNLMTGVSASDNSGINPTITYEGSLSATVGTQTVTYKATDQAGNVTTKVRTFNITKADAPVLNFSSISSNNLWIGSTKITATASDIDNLTAFSYSINGGAETNVPVNGKSASVEIPLSSTGTYTIKIKATGSYQNSAELSSGEYKIDTTKPTVSNLTASTAWSTSNKITGTGTDSHSGISYYAVTTNSNVPTSWTSVTNTTSYSISYNATSNGTYYVWVKDKVGNYNYGTVTVSKVDNVAPTITARNTPYTATVGTNYATTNFYTVSYGPSGGSTVCRNGSTTVTNVSSLGVGSYTLTCTATSTAGKSASVNISVTIKNLSYVYYTTAQGNTSYNWDLYRCNIDGSNCNKITTLMGNRDSYITTDRAYGYAASPTVSIGENYMYYTTAQGNTSYNWDLYRCNIDGSNCNKITTLMGNRDSYITTGRAYGYAASPTVSIGKNYMYYTTAQGNTSYNWDLYRCNIDGSNCNKITTLMGNRDSYITTGRAYGYATSPKVSIGENYMYYTTAQGNTSYNWDLYRCNIDGSNCNKITTLMGNRDSYITTGRAYGYATSPTVSIGKNYMYYTTAQGNTSYNWDLYRCNIDGSNCNKITTLMGNRDSYITTDRAYGYATSPKVSIGENYMYYTTAQGNTSYNWDLYRCNIDGSNCNKITTLMGNRDSYITTGRAYGYAASPRVATK